MENKKILICGYLALGKSHFGGQGIKTRELYYAAQKRYGEENIDIVDTCGWIKRPLALFLEFSKKAKLADTVIMLPAHKGLKVFSRLLLWAKKKQGVKIFYDVIGGWLPKVTKENNALKKVLLNFDGIWVESVSMQASLTEQGFNNITLLPNFKDLKLLTEDELTYNHQKPYSLCTFSRVLKVKGIEDAVNAVTEINEKEHATIYTLDIYGQVDDGYKEEFEHLTKTFPDYIRYKGTVDPRESVSTIKNYFALLFPTRYHGEGFPGTLIDAMAAGVPVITSRFLTHKDIFKEGVTGRGYEFESYECLVALLEEIANEPEEFLKMKTSSLAEGHNYTPDTVLKTVDRQLGI